MAAPGRSSEKQTPKTRKIKIATDLTDMGDEEEEMKEEGVDITSSEDEEGDEDQRKRRKLLDAISSLGGRRRKTMAERCEAAVLMSEFTVNAQGGSEQISLSDLIGSVEKTPAVSSTTKKQLKGLQDSHTLQSPLSKQETQRIQRDIAFQKTAAEVSRWQSIVQQNQKAEQLVFPLNQEPAGPRPVERLVAGWKPHTPLEEEIFQLLHANRQPTYDVALTPVEEASLKAMSLEEAKMRRAELQKSRALQSYYEAKAKRERRIKSKKFHKVQNKAKRKDFLKQFDEMAKTDPAAALEELNKIQLSRMKERMSLKHQNSGKWAKAKALMAKYDEGARQAMQQQLEVNKELTQKLANNLEEEEGEEEEAELLPDFVNDAELVVDPSNPWMRGKLSGEPDPSKEDGLASAETGTTEIPDEDEEPQTGPTEEEELLRTFEARREERREKEEEEETIPMCETDDEDAEKEADVGVESKEMEKPEEEEEGEEEEEVGEDEVKTQEILLKASETPEEWPETTETEPIVPPVNGGEVVTEGTAPAPAAKKEKRRKRKRAIDMKQVLTKDTIMIQTPLDPTTVCQSETAEDQMSIIKEAFAGDDVISDFLKDKRKQEELGRPKVVDLTLPGWGEWGGLGLKPSRKKRRRFRVKAPPAPVRKDGKLPTVIISETRNRSVTLHQVNTLPFPFENPSQFEATIRAPVGGTWNTQQTVNKITAPKVVTQLGAIIQPMSREEKTKARKKTK